MLAALCLAAAGLHTSLLVTHFTLRWHHSIEKVQWDEDYDVVGSWLHLSEARIRGSGAGMEPPEGARLVNGVFHYRLADPWRREVVLARSTFVPDYELCIDGRCRRLTQWLPISAGPATLTACTVPGRAGR